MVRDGVSAPRPKSDSAPTPPHRRARQLPGLPRARAWHIVCCWTGSMPSIRQAHRLPSLSVAVLVAVLGSGCLSTRHVARPSTPQDLENAIAAADGSVTLLEGPPASPALTDTTREVRPVAIKPEGIWVASGAEPPRLLQVMDLRGFEVRRHGLGFWEGADIGLLPAPPPAPPPATGSRERFLRRQDHHRRSRALVGGVSACLPAAWPGPWPATATSTSSTRRAEGKG